MSSHIQLTSSNDILFFKSGIRSIVSDLRLLLLLFFFTVTVSFAQECDCKKNFEWVKNTFENNDAGFAFALEEKGDQAYADHNKRISRKINSAVTLDDCVPILREWLAFFRSGHVAIRWNPPSSEPSGGQQAQEQPQDWETYPIDEEAFRKYLDKKEDHDYEGIWETGPYKIGIKKEKDQYIGSIIKSSTPSWTRDQVKLKFSLAEDKVSSVFYMRDRSPEKSDQVSLSGKNLLHIGDFNLFRLYPKIAYEPMIERYGKLLNTRTPYLEAYNETTLYFRIPSFQPAHKPAIDSVIKANRGKILSSENLIIDIRNGTGGSDSSYREILPFIYTNPIRTVGVEFFSTELNNQRMIDLVNKPEYGLDEETKKWAKEAFKKLEERRGEFVNLDERIVTMKKLDTIYPFPKNVGIIINHRNGSTDEQFLLAAKQSKKVKLFGTTTFGVLDISNMYFVPSPCNEFDLGYALSKSMRVPGMTIDGKGLQPDYYFDRSVPLYEWTERVNEILNEK